MKIFRVFFRAKRPRIIFAAFILGWLSARISSHVSNIFASRNLIAAHINPTSIPDEDALQSCLFTEKTWPRQDTQSTALYRELHRRRAIKTVNHMWNVASANLSTVQKVISAADAAEKWAEQLNAMASSMKKFLRDSTLFILANLRRIENMDDLNIHRKELLSQLSAVVRMRIKALQVKYHEAESHDLSEYMVHVDRYFDYVDEIRALEDEKHRPYQPKVRRQIYLASDDPSVFRDVKAHYPHYLVHYTTAKNFAAKAGTMYPTESETHIAMEIFLLSFTDYIVCTLSSNVCRLAYELMQARQSTLGDAGDLVETLDTNYFWNHGQSLTCEMAQDEEDMNLHRGDVVDVWSGHLNAAFERQRLRNKVYYISPSYKCIPRVIIADMKSYSMQGK